jgi:hypothetical protein
MQIGAGVVRLADTNDCEFLGGPRTSRLAVAAFVASLLGFWVWVGLQSLDHRPQSHTARNQIIQLLAILSATLVLSLVALATVVLSRKRAAGRGWAAAGALISAILVLLTLTVGLPMLDTVHQAVCQKNLMQLALVLEMYAGDNGDLLPTTSWSDRALSEVGRDVWGIFRCPEAPGLRCAYAFNRALMGRSIKTIPQPERTVLLFESDLGWNSAGGPDALVRTPRHSGKDVFAFADGSVKLFDRKQESDLIWYP